LANASALDAEAVLAAESATASRACASPRFVARATPTRRAESALRTHARADVPFFTSPKTTRARTSSRPRQSSALRVRAPT
jgi:hypothetical protein